MTGILAGLAEQTRQRPHVAATLLPAGPVGRGLAGYRATTFAQLDERSDVLAAGLVALGATGGTRAAMLVPVGEDFFALSFALLKAGAVPVLVDPGIGAARLGRCLAEAQPAVFLGSPKARAARMALRWVPDARTVSVAHAERAGRARLRAGGGAAGAPQSGGGALLGAPQPDGETAAVAFTTGSTGPPKGVCYRHPHFAAQLDALRTLYDLEPGGVSLATFPPFALFGPALGLTTVVPRMDPTRPARADPRVILHAANAFGATVMFGSPALLRNVGRHAARTGARLRSLRTVVSAGAAVPEPVVRDMVATLGDGGRVVTPYGATEALPVTSIASDELLGLAGGTGGETGGGRAAAGGWARFRGVCVGRPIPRVDVAVVAVHDRPVRALPAVLPPGEIGEVVVRGPVVTEDYLGRPQATAMAKLDWGGRPAHRMGDLGWLDDQGRLWFCGRVAHRVVTTDATLYPLPCEQVFTAHRAVARAALVGVGRPGQQRPVMCIEPEAGTAPSSALTAELLALGAGHAHTRAVRTVLYRRRFPVDVRHNAKVGYEELTRWAARQL